MVSLVMLLFILSGCVHEKETEENVTLVGQTQIENENKMEDVIRLGVSHFGMGNELITSISAAQEEMAKELGVEISIFDANYDMNTQLAQFEKMIVEDYDAIIFSPVDVNAMTLAVDKAYAAGVPVFGVNTKVNSDKLVSYIGSNDTVAGKIGMSYIAMKIGGKGSIVILEGVIGSSVQIQRLEGIHDVVDLYPDIEILSEMSASWSHTEARKLMELWLQAYPDQIDGVVAQNDEMALGAVEALEAVGLKDNIPVIGIDASSDALTAVKEGRLDATVYQNVGEQGRKSVQVAVDYMNGKKVSSEYWVPFVLVTQQNIDDYID